MKKLKNKTKVLKIADKKRVKRFRRKLILKGKLSRKIYRQPTATQPRVLKPQIEPIVKPIKHSFLYRLYQWLKLNWNKLVR